MKIIIKVLKFILLAIVLTSTAYSQQVHSAYFSVGQMGNNKGNIIRAYTAGNMVVMSSFTPEDRITKFSFFKQGSSVVKYIELPYDYTVNDFVILDNYIYFCGKTSFRNSGYIGMSEISTSLQGTTGYQLLAIDSAATLTKIVAYKGETSSTIGIVAIGKPKDSAYTSCVVDVNNYRESNLVWKYWYGHIAGEEITDICNAGALVATVAKVKPSSGLSFFIPALLLRTYKKDNIFAEAMSDAVNKYSNSIHPYEGGGFLVEQLNANNIVAVGTSKSNLLFTYYYPITISKININSFIMTNKQQITYDSTRSRNIVDLEYFPTTNKLGILTNVPNTFGELLFSDMSKTSSYTSSRLKRADNLFNSITESNNGDFEITCLARGIMTTNAFILHENIDIFKESHCSTTATMPVSAQSVNIAPTIEIKSFDTHNKVANWIHYSTTLYETDVDIHCANYYK